MEACSEARRAVLAGDGAVPVSARDDILLLVSELITNAVRHGWGLVLVDRIADRWGIISETGRTCVWFELPSA
jgi:two-component sensor histidine kinase